MRLLADWDHDGKVDAAPPNRPDEAFVIVPLVPEGVSPLLEPAPLRVETGADASPGNIELRTDPPTARVRLYVRQGGGWRLVPPIPGGWHVDVGTSPMELGVGATPPAPPGDPPLPPNGFTLTVTHGAETKSVRCRIAPILLASSLDPVTEVLVVRNDLTRRFAEELARLVPRAEGAPKVRFLDYDEVPHDVWVQDAVEIGVCAVPSNRDGVGGVRQVPVPLLGLRARHDGIKTAPLDAFVAAHFGREAGVVPVQAAEPRPGTRWIDWYGNLEVSPPVRGFPHGRILTGRQKELGFHPDLLAFLEAQKLQWPPLVLDVSWLTIGHVDELINFVPAPPGRPGFRALLPSPRSARDLLREAVKRGEGDAAVFPGKKGATTVRRLLEEVGDSAETDAIEASLAETRRALEKELGIGENDIVPLPVLFRDGLPVVPNGVNSLVAGRHLFVPAPCGPVVNGADLFEKAIRARLEPLGLTLHFPDIWEPYHVRSGEIHCGTNAVRRLRNPRWWQTSPAAS